MIVNPRTVTATPPSQRVDGQPVAVDRISLELGYRLGSAWTVIDEKPSLGEPIIFELADLDTPADETIILGVRAVEARPDLVTDEFPSGVDLFSTWAEGGEVAFANPPAAPEAVTVGAG